MEDLLDTYSKLIRSIATKFYGVPKNELYHVGTIGLYNAYKHYNNSLNVKFSTFAYSYIFGEMYELYRSLKVIHPP